MPGFPIYYWVRIMNWMEEVQHYGLWHVLCDKPVVPYMFFVTMMMSFVMVSNALLTIEESKFIGLFQLSTGPSKVAPFGKLQPMADALKLLLKEYIRPNQVESNLYKFMAQYGFFAALGFWYLAPMIWNFVAVHSELSMVISFLMSMSHAYSVLMGGWSSKSKYAFLGALSSAAQVMAYDMAIMLVYLNICVYTSDLSFLNVLQMQAENTSLIWIFPIQFVVFFIANMAETSSHPFDLPEAEPELVSGYNVEYSSMSFALFFLAEYANVLYFAILLNSMFFNSWGGILSIYIMNVPYLWLDWVMSMAILIFVIMKFSALIPSYSFDQLMALGWKCLMPFELVSLFLNMFMHGYV